MFIKLEKFIINTNLIESFDDKTIWFAGSGQSITISGADYIKLKDCLLSVEEEIGWNNHETPSKVKPGQLGDLLTKLHNLLGGRGEAKLTTDRKARLTTRLKDFSPEELIKAAEILGTDEFMQGGNDSGKRYGTIDYLIRTSANINKWLEESPKKEKKMF